MTNLYIVNEGLSEVELHKKVMKEVLTEKFNKKGNYELSFMDGSLNITDLNQDRLNVEFYDDGEMNYYTATYEINGKEKDLFFDMPEQVTKFVNTVVKILNQGY